MNPKNLLLLFLFTFSLLSFNGRESFFGRKEKSAISIQEVWTLDTLNKNRLRLEIPSNSPPLLTKNLVIQGNAFDGVKAYTRDQGKKIWDFFIPSGVASPLLYHKGNLYFGGADGFFYSLQSKTGELNWKFWTGSENSSSPLIYKNRLYWTANNQKVYAFTLKGKRLWMYSGPPTPQGFFVRGRPAPLAYKNQIYVGFYDGSLVVLNRNNGQLKWKKSLAPGKAINENMGVSGNCLFVPVFDFHLFCLNPRNGRVRWKSGRASSSSISPSAIYQLRDSKLYALKKFDAKEIWSQKEKGLSPPLKVSVFKNYLIYGSPSRGYLTFADRKNGKVLKTHRFGKGLAAPVTGDFKKAEIYFISIEGYLHKLSVL